MPAPSGGALATKPLSVEQIVQQAQSYDYNPQIPLRYWLRSANTLLKEAEIYDGEGNDQQAYLLLFRHAQLVLGQLTQHPDVGPAYRGALAQAERDVKAGLAKMEVLKPRIAARHERYLKLLRERAAARSPSDPAARQQQQQQGPQPEPQATEALAAGENRDLAVQLARKEIRRRAAARKATLRAGISEEEEQERRTAGVWGNWDSRFAEAATSAEGDALSRQMQNIRLQVDGRRRELEPRRLSQRHSATYNYPAVQPSKGLPAAPSREPSFVASQDAPPAPPPKDEILYGPTPPRPAKEPLQPPSQPASPPPSKQELQPSGFTFKPAAHLENGTPLRTMFLPPDLRQRFLAAAEPNTRANLETCGILCGTLISNALFVSRLVIPEQESTSDTCETKNEEALFDYVDSEDLLVLGWIHTHPTQTCFMSSRDLHTHSGYQAMMPESIAIVCAPSQPADQTWGAFRLTDPPGLQAVLRCTRAGLFHPHDETHMYTDALRPGHVFEARGLEYDVHDMRKG